MSMRFESLVFLLIFSIGLAACDDDLEVHDPAEHACEHAELEGERLTAAANRDATAPPVELGEPATIALPDGASGWVRFEVDHPGGILAFARDANVLTAFYLGDDEEELISAGPNEACSEDLREHFHLTVEEAGSFYLRLGPTATNEGWLLLTDAAGHGGDHD